MRKLILITVISAFIAAPAMADLIGTVNVRELNVSPGTTAGIKSSGFTSGPAVYIGVYNLQLSGVAGVPTYMEPYLTGNVQSFCIDLWDLSAPGTEPYLVKTLDQVPDAQQAPGNTGMGPVKAGYLATLLDQYWVAGLTNLEAAAVQAAVWEVVDEDRANPLAPNTAAWNTSWASAGSFAVNNANIANRANQMLAFVVGAGVSPFGNYVGLWNNTTGPNEIPGGGQYQDYVVRVPVPAAVLLGMLGLSVAGIKLRKHA